MRRWTIILILVIIFLLILIAIFSIYGTAPKVSGYAHMETQMRKLWY